VGLPLGIPLELVLMDWTKSNFSQSRAVLQQMRQNFAQLQQLLVKKIMVPIYEWRIRQAMSDGELPANAGWSNIEFVTPPFPSLDPKQESEAYGQQIDRALTTKARLLKSLGYDFEELTSERQAEIADCMRRAKELEAQHGQSVPWEILYGMNANTSYNKPEAAPPPEEKPEEAANEAPAE
jgi:capsid protein